MHYGPLPPNLEKGIERFASEQHISTAEALRKVVETGLMAIKPAPQGSLTGAQCAIVAEALRKAELVRAARTEELAELSTRNESAGLLIGFLKEEPEIVEAIRQAAHEHRKALYN